MAEWSGGVRPRRRSIPAELENKSMRRVVPNLPDAPGAVQSPQIPGMVPDRSDLPGHDEPRYPANRHPQRPISQYGTAEELWGVYRPTGPDGTWVAEDFNGMSSPPWEELRKVNPALLTPGRPAPGYETERALALAEMRRLALEAAVEAGVLEAGQAAETAMPLTGAQAAAVEAVPPGRTLLGEAGAASAPASAGSMSTGDMAAHAPVVDAAQREGSLTGLGAPAEAVTLAAESLVEIGHEKPELIGEAVPQSPVDRSLWAKAAPQPAEFAGAAETIELMPAPAGVVYEAAGVAPAVEPPLVPEGAVGAEVRPAAASGLIEAAPQARDVVPEGGEIAYVVPAAAAGVAAAAQAQGGASADAEIAASAVAGSEAESGAMAGAGTVSAPEGAEAGGHVDLSAAHVHAATPMSDDLAVVAGGGEVVEEIEVRETAGSGHDQGLGHGQVNLDAPRSRAATPASDDLAVVAGAEAMVEEVVVETGEASAEAAPSVTLPPPPRPRGVLHETPEAGPVGDGWWEGSGAARVVGGGEIAHPAVVAKGLGQRDPAEGEEWLEESALAPAVEPRRPKGGDPADAADMGGDLYPGDQSAPGRPAREGGDDRWLGLELETAGIADVAGAEAMGIAAEAATRAEAEAAVVPTPAGAVRSEGHRNCPPAHPVKGNLKSMLFHLPRDGSYEQTIPEFCFKSPQAAEAAGFTRVGKRK